MNGFFVAFFMCLAAMVSGGSIVLGHNDGQWRGEGLLESQDWAGRSAWASPVSAWGAPGLVNSGVWGSGLVRSGVVANTWGNAWAPRSWAANTWAAPTWAAHGGW